MAQTFEIVLEDFAFPRALPDNRANFRLVFDVRYITRTGAFATEHVLLIFVFELMLLCTAATASWLAHRTGRRGTYGYLLAAVLLSGVGIFLHAAPVIAGMGLLAFATIRLALQARTAGIC